MPPGSFNVVQLWQMVTGARQELPPSRTQVDAWQRASSMLDQHSAALLDCRRQLAEIWPPETNAAAAAYMAELDRLIDAAQQTSSASANNATHINYVADAIEQTETTLKPIYEEYVNNQQKLADYQRQVEQAGNIGGTIGQAYGGVGGRLLGDWAGESIYGAVTTPPVEDGRQEELNRRAREVMARLDATARDSGNRVQPPPDYVPPELADAGGGDEFGEESEERPVRPPVIPPPRHRLDRTEESRPGFIDGHLPESGPVTTLPQTEPPYSGYDDDGPGLSSVVPPPPTATPPTPIPPPPPGSPLPPPVGPGPGLGTPGLIPGVSPLSGGGKIPSVSGPGAGRAGPLGAAKIGGGGGVPPGGVIGGRPGGGVGGVPIGGGGGMPMGGGAAPRANPVGGVIGPSGGAAGGRGAGGGAAGGRGAGMAGGPGGRRGQQGSDDRDSQHWDPDNPWAVEEGVAPSIEPNRTVSRHDPGTGVLGQDR